MLLVARPRRSTSTPQLSVIIPAYNESFRLPVVLDALRHHVNHERTEIIVVDDGSTDGTAEVAQRAADWCNQLVVLAHVTNRGKGAAVRTGVAAAHGDAICFIDADNATDLAALAPMVAALGPDVGAVFGSRHARGSHVTGAPAIRGLMGRVFNHLVKIAAGTDIRDTQCGAKVFRAPVARVVFAQTRIDGFAFDVEILRRLLSLGVSVIEYPVTWHYVHGTKIRLTTPLRMMRDIARIRTSPPAPPPPHVEVAYDESIAHVADPFSPNTVPKVGEVVQVVLPHDDGSFLPDAKRRRADAWPPG